MHSKSTGPRSLFPIVGTAAILLVPALSAATDIQAKSEIPAQSPILPQSDAPAALPYGADIADELGNRAVVANPGLHALKDRVGALEQKVHLAGAWLDPTFSAEYSSMPIVNPIPDQHPMSGIQFVLKQTFNWSGKIRAREDEAEHRVKLEQLSLAEQQVQLRATVKRVYVSRCLDNCERSRGNTCSWSATSAMSFE